MMITENFIAGKNLVLGPFNKAESISHSQQRPAGHMIRSVCGMFGNHSNLYFLIFFIRSLEIRTKDVISQQVRLASRIGFKICEGSDIGFKAQFQVELREYVGIYFKSAVHFTTTEGDNNL